LRELFFADESVAVSGLLGDALHFGQAVGVGFDFGVVFGQGVAGVGDGVLVNAGFGGELLLVKGGLGKVGFVFESGDFGVSFGAGGLVAFDAGDFEFR
jgi:hypothetical protein